MPYTKYLTIKGRSTELITSAIIDFIAKFVWRFVWVCYLYKVFKIIITSKLENYLLEKMILITEIEIEMNNDKIVLLLFLAC